MFHSIIIIQRNYKRWSQKVMKTHGNPKSINTICSIKWSVPLPTNKYKKDCRNNYPNPIILKITTWMKKTKRKSYFKRKHKRYKHYTIPYKMTSMNSGCFKNTKPWRNLWHVLVALYKSHSITMNSKMINSLSKNLKILL